MKPQRIQLRRTKGWRMPENTVRVCRPGTFGNPYWVGAVVELPQGERLLIKDAATAKTMFEAMLNTWPRQLLADWLKPLAGKNLACWCPMDQPCHADTLLNFTAAFVTPNAGLTGESAAKEIL